MSPPPPRGVSSSSAAAADCPIGLADLKYQYSLSSCEECYANRCQKMHPEMQLKAPRSSQADNHVGHFCSSSCGSSVLMLVAMLSSNNKVWYTDIYFMTTKHNYLNAWYSNPSHSSSKNEMRVTYPSSRTRLGRRSSASKRAAVQSQVV